MTVSVTNLFSRVPETMPSPRLAILASHPVQYYAPLFRELAERVDLQVFYAHNAMAPRLRTR